jgi:parvulin-like peptidyl-prolyl isomerase
MTRLLKDPLLHFLLIGGALFAFAAWRGQSVQAGRERIVITGAQVAAIRDTAALLQQRQPTAAELEQLVEPTVREEVLYREALALGLDKDDDEVRRRLVEKMSYLTQDLADPEPASEAELRAFYEREPARFTIPPLVTFDQVFFGPDRHGAALNEAAAAGLAALKAGKAPAEVGDDTPLRASYDAAPRDQVEVLFGAAIADALFTEQPGDWRGPFRSDFGAHVVRLRARSEQRLPPYDEIRDRVLEQFAAVRRQQRNDAEYRRMRSRYDVVIEAPPPAAAAGASTP